MTIVTMDKRKETKLILTAFFASGAAALIYEVIWTRVLSLVLGSTVYAMSTMLSTFMAGLALGSYLGGKISDRSDRLIFFFGICEVAIGIFGVASIPLITMLPPVYLSIYRQFHLSPPLFFTAQIALCAMVMLPPTILMGATFPLVSRKITVNLAEMGSRVGNAYGANTVGAVLGSLLVGFLLIPKFGIKGASYVAAVLNLLTGIGMITMAGKWRERIALALVPSFLLSLFWSIATPLEANAVNFFKVRSQIDKPYRHHKGVMSSLMTEVFYEENPEGTVRGFRDSEGNFILKVNGKVEGSAKADIPNNIMAAYLPIASHPAPDNFLLIGLGTGHTLGAAKEFVKDVSLVEINSGVIKAVRQHGEPHVLDGVRIINNDARNHLLRTDKKYDILASAPSYPTNAAVTNLYTREFYDIASRKLNPGGVYFQWLPYYIFSNYDVTILLKTFASAFPHAQLWKLPRSMNLLLIGSDSPFPVTSQEIGERISAMNKGRYDLVYTISREPHQLQEIAKNGNLPLNTDDKPILEFSAVNNLILGDMRLVDLKGTMPE